MNQNEMNSPNSICTKPSSSFAHYRLLYMTGMKGERHLQQEICLDMVGGRKGKTEGAAQISQQPPSDSKLTNRTGFLISSLVSNLSRNPSPTRVPLMATFWVRCAALEREWEESVRCS
mmetsp:Transcript_9003/g.17614  ORF Transcript_9003/g.17614 Transcript_9003/m.17614 type:complete len:118 (+) Transcript_9003:533-886(+)